MISVPGLGLGAGVGCIVGIALGAYLKGMFEESGKIDAAMSRLEDVGKKAFKEAFEGEAGKRLASHQDLTNVLNELRKVTTETESIKAQISGDTWLKQTVWVQKRDAYAVLLKVLTELHDSYIELTSSLSALEIREADPQAGDLHFLKLDAEKKRNITYRTQFQATIRFNEAELFDEGIRKQAIKFSHDRSLETVTKENSTADDARDYLVALMTYRLDLMEHMRRELGTDGTSDRKV